jgi:predicted RNA-binding protein associated with RNAse of E/G family
VTGRFVEIHYRRLPDREDVFRQRVLEEAEDCVVTLLERAELRRPVEVAGRAVLEPGAPGTWFTYPGRWYDIGRFHLADGTFTGHYANLLTPVRMEGPRWETTDLMLDVWCGADGHVEILDEAEFADAVERGWITPPTAATAREHAETLALAARQGEWPSARVRTWSLEKALGSLNDES